MKLIRVRRLPVQAGNVERPDRHTAGTSSCWQIEDSTPWAGPAAHRAARKYRVLGR